MIFKIHAYWNDRNSRDGRYHAKEILVDNPNAVSGLIRSWYESNITTDGLGCVIETTEDTSINDNTVWNTFYSGFLNNEVCLGLSCRLKGVTFND